MPARRLQLPEPTSAEHPGLVLARYLSEPVGNGNERFRDTLYQQARKACQSEGLRNLYQLAYSRWKAELAQLPACWQRFEYVSPVTVGLGGENVTETGLTLHRTCGVPYLPGSALKGLASRFARNRLTAEAHRTVFGTTSEGGLVEFLDGWIPDTAVRNCLADEVVTPHHGEYYSASDDVLAEPTDFDDPVPVPFLAVRSSFLIAVAKRDPRLPRGWLELAMNLLGDALREQGIGGKTAAGYGRLRASGNLEWGGQLENEAAAPLPDVPTFVVEVFGPNDAGHLECVGAEDALGIISNPEAVPESLRVPGTRVRVTGGGPLVDGRSHWTFVGPDAD